MCETYISGSYRTIAKEKLSNGTKYSLSASYDGTKIKNRYNNQKYEENLTGTIGYPLSNTIMILGANPNDSVPTGGYFAGTIHSVRIYSRALTDEENEVNYRADQARYGI